VAKRQKLSLQQKRRVASSKQNKLKQRSAAPSFENDHLGPLQKGVVISRFGEQADVADGNKTVYRIYLRQNLGSCVSGDKVLFRLNEQSQGVIEAIEPRTSELTRPTPYAGVKTIVANVDQIFVMVAPFPDYSSLILDRYLVACELAGITTHIMLNKTDLLDPEKQAFFDQQISLYQQLGYQVFSSSCKTGQGIEALKQQMAGKENIFVGQSGVGKSSLINQLLPDVTALTGQVSENSRLGTHTTTASRLYFLPDSGFIIDSPGVREFGLSHIEPELIIQGFIELQPLQGDCKFRNCQHQNEKGCALIRAAEQGTISKQRLKNYQKIALSA